MEFVHLSSESSINLMISWLAAMVPIKKQMDAYKTAVT